MDLQRLRADIADRGYAVLDDVDEPWAMAIAAAFGRVLPDPRTQALIREIRPQPKATANPNTLSSRYGTGAFPFHTEAAYFRAPPRFVFLYCASPGSGSRPTLLLDGAALIARLATMTPATWVMKSGRVPFLCQAVERVDATTHMLRYDAACMFPSGARAHRQCDCVDDYIRTQTPLRVDWRAGMLAIVDNRRCLHGRGEADGDDADRVLKRIIVH